MIEKINQYIEYLSFCHLDKEKEFWARNFIACNARNSLPSTSRVFIPDTLNPDDYIALQNYFCKNNFTFWIAESNDAGNQTIKETGASLRFSYPLMSLNLNHLSASKINPSIHVKKITSPDDILSVWAPLVARAYEKIDVSEFQKFTAYLLSTSAHKNIQFYIGYYSDQPCATSMIILRDNLCDIHWVGTLPEFRNLGLGFAVTQYPLIQLKTIIDEAILYASEMGKPIYEKMGFKELCKVNVYYAFGT